MTNIRKVLIGRILILATVLISGVAMAIAVYQDRQQGSLLDNQGVIDRDFVDEPATLPLAEELQ